MDHFTTKIKSLTYSHPLGSFVFLALVFSLIPFITLQVLIPQLILLRSVLVGFAPMLAAFMVVSSLKGESISARTLVKSLLHWRFSAGYYGIALFGPCLVLFLSWFILSVFGVESNVITPRPSDFVFIILTVLISGPIGEEVGFRGFALPYLLQRYSFVSASLIVGGLAGLWRLPIVTTAAMGLFSSEPARMILFLIGSLLGTISMAVPLGWLYVKTNSLIAPILIRLVFSITFFSLFVPEDLKAFSFAVSILLITALWAILRRIPLPPSVSARPTFLVIPYIVFQVIAVISVPLWFFFYILFNINNPVAGRDVSFVIYFLFGTLWHIPVFLGVVSTVMWGAFLLRFKRVTLISGVALCLPIAAFIFILMLQSLEYQRLIHK